MNADKLFSSGVLDFPAAINILRKEIVDAFHLHMKCL